METEANSSVAVGEYERVFKDVVETPFGDVGPVHAKVSVSLSKTINIGNYESVRVSVGIEMPVDPKQVNRAYAFSKNWCGKRLASLSDEYGT